jgi:hypothetical protein
MEWKLFRMVLGCRPQQADDYFRQSDERALEVAAGCGHLPIMRLLLDWGSGVLKANFGDSRALLAAAKVTSQLYMLHTFTPSKLIIAEGNMTRQI